LKEWQLFAADKQCSTGSLRRWHQDEYFPVGIHDIWGYKSGSDAWQMQLMLQEVNGDKWYCRRNNAIGGNLKDFICHYGEISCIRIEIQLMYKAKNYREKDNVDFQACLPHLSSEAQTWLKNSLSTMFANGHDWTSILERM
jgi:hypothetical protein